MKRLLAVLATVFAAQSAVAEDHTYHCNVKGRDGWIAPEYYFRIDPEGGMAQVVSSYHDWTETKLKTRRNNILQMTWAVTLPSSEGQAIRMRYQANLDPATNTVKVRGSFVNVGASNKPFGTGSCSLRK